MSDRSLTSNHQVLAELDAALTSGKAHFDDMELADRIVSALEGYPPRGETPREHPPELMAVVDKWQDYANALRKGHLPSYSTQDRTIDALLSEVRRTVAPQVKTGSALPDRIMKEPQ